MPAGQEAPEFPSGAKSLRPKGLSYNFESMELGCASQPGVAEPRKRLKLGRALPMSAGSAARLGRGVSQT
jgi:hypothetical protein